MNVIILRRIDYSMIDSAKTYWIARGTVIQLWAGKPEYFTPYNYFRGNLQIILIDALPPQLQEMWRFALDGKYGDDAVCEVCPETWIPFVEVNCAVCKRNKDFFDRHPENICKNCGGKPFRLMTADDLPKKEEVK